MTNIIAKIKPLFLSIGLMLWGISAFGQIDLFAAETFQLRSWRDAIAVYGFAGAGGALAYGKYIRDYQNTFHQVTDPQGEISGGVLPTLSLSGGARISYAPFENTPLSNFYLAIDLLYSQRGFRNRYRAEIIPEDIDYRDNSHFVESYQMHMLALPFVLGWGLENWFGEIGLSGENMVYGQRVHKFKRDVTGSEAYEGGFSTKASYRERLGPIIIAPKNGSNLILAGGKRYESGSALRLSLMISPQTFYTDPNFRNLSVHLQWVFPLVSLASSSQSE